jgi:hypothetical protein
LKGLILGNNPVTGGPLPDLIPLDDRKIKKNQSVSLSRKQTKRSLRNQIG